MHVNTSLSSSVISPTPPIFSKDSMLLSSLHSINWSERNVTHGYVNMGLLWTRITSLGSTAGLMYMHSHPTISKWPSRKQVFGPSILTSLLERCSHQAGKHRVRLICLFHQMIQQSTCLRRCFESSQQSMRPKMNLMSSSRPQWQVHQTSPNTMWSTKLSTACPEPNLLTSFLPHWLHPTTPCPPLSPRPSLFPNLPPSLLSNPKLKLNCYSLPPFENPRRWTTHSPTETLPCKLATCLMRCTVAMRRAPCRPRRTRRRRRVQGPSQMAWLASWLQTSFMKLTSISRRDNAVRQRQRRRRRMPRLPGKRPSRSGNQVKMHALHWGIGRRWYTRSWRQFGRQKMQRHNMGKGKGVGMVVVQSWQSRRRLLFRNGYLLPCWGTFWPGTMENWVRMRAAALAAMTMAVARTVKAQTTTTMMSKPFIATYLTCDIDGVMPSYTGVSLSHIGPFWSSFPISLYLLHFSFISHHFFLFMLVFAILVQWLL